MLTDIIAAYPYPEAAAIRDSAHGKRIRDIAYALKRADLSAIVVAANALVLALPHGLRNLVLVPVPSSLGFTDANHALAEAIAERVGGGVLDVLSREPGPSCCDRRRNGLPGLAVEEMPHQARDRVPEGAFLVDNVATTGRTLEAAARACGVPVVGLVWAIRRNPVRM